MVDQDSAAVPSIIPGKSSFFNRFRNRWSVPSIISGIACSLNDSIYSVFLQSILFLQSNQVHAFPSIIFVPLCSFNHLCYMVFLQSSMVHAFPSIIFDPLCSFNHLWYTVFLQLSHVNFSIYSIYAIYAEWMFLSPVRRSEEEESCPTSLSGVRVSSNPCRCPIPGILDTLYARLTM